MNIYDFDVKTIDGKTISLSQFRDKILLIVNVASQCRFTPQYHALQRLYEKYQSKQFEILAFPCNQFLLQEPDDNHVIKDFCQIHYAVSFPLFAKINVNGQDTHPLYQFLKTEARGIFSSKTIKWNFTKFLVNRDGKVVRRFAPMTNIKTIENVIEKLFLLYR